MLRDTLVGLIEPMQISAGVDPLALTIQKQASDDSPSCLANPRPDRAESSLTENATSPFQAEPAHDPADGSTARIRYGDRTARSWRTPPPIRTPRGLACPDLRSPKPQLDGELRFIAPHPTSCVSVSGNIARVAGFELFVSVSQQAFTTQTGFLVGTTRRFARRSRA